jgi:hypothetical protein
MADDARVDINTEPVRPPRNDKMKFFVMNFEDELSNNIVTLKFPNQYDPGIIEDYTNNLFYFMPK